MPKRKSKPILKNHRGGTKNEYAKSPVQLSELKQLSLDVEGHPEATAGLKRFLSDNPTPKRIDIIKFKPKIVALINLEQSRKITGNANLLSEEQKSALENKTLHERILNIKSMSFSDMSDDDKSIYLGGVWLKRVYVFGIFCLCILQSIMSLSFIYDHFNGGG